MTKIRFREGVIDQMKRDRNLDADSQACAALGVSIEDLDRMRHGAQISSRLALQFAAIQGTGFDLTRWVEPIPAAPAA